MPEWFMTLRPQHIRLFTARYYLLWKVLHHINIAIVGYIATKKKQGDAYRHQHGDGNTFLFHHLSFGTAIDIAM